MSFPYLSDIINFWFGTRWNISVAMFGTFVALAIFVATAVAKKEVRRFEALGLLPQATLGSVTFAPVHVVLSELVTIVAIVGVFGARLFHILEHTAEFVENPLGMIFSTAGLSIYGGLICGGIAGATYLKKRCVPIIPMLDALSPSIILGYGIGRIGCQISGDGDWGIASNMALKPSFIPDWLWAQTYQNNIAGVSISFPGVYPTPIYESLTAFSIFLLLWTIRKNNHSTGYMISMYLLMSGFGRLLIEKIRINSPYHFLTFNFTQAELISAMFILIGLYGILKSIHARYISKIVISLVVIATLTACSRL